MKINVERNRAKRDIIASVASAEKCQCLLCGKWYIQVGSHVFQVHGMTGREYREHFELEVKRGIVPKWYRKLEALQVEVMEDYLHLAEMRHFAKNDVAHMEETNIQKAG